MLLFALGIAKSLDIWGVLMTTGLSCPSAQLGQGWDEPQEKLGCPWLQEKLRQELAENLQPSIL